MRAVRIAYQVSIFVLFVVAALCMRAHPAIAGVLVAFATAMLALMFLMSRRVDQIAAAVAARDVDELERIANRTLAYRYQAALLVGVLGSAKRARSLGRVTPCVCGECEMEDLDRELSRALDACELLENQKTLAALRLMKQPPNHKLARTLHGPFALWVALHAKKMPAGTLERIEGLAPKAGFMRWPLESLIAARLEKQGDVERSRKRLENAPAAWRAILR